MATINDKFENVKAVILSVHKNTTTKDKVGFYDTWAEKYDQVRAAALCLTLITHLNAECNLNESQSLRMWQCWIIVHQILLPTPSPLISMETVMQLWCWMWPVAQG